MKQIDLINQEIEQLTKHPEFPHSIYSKLINYIYPHLNRSQIHSVKNLRCKNEKLAGDVLAAFKEVMQMRLEAKQRYLETIKERIKETESALEAEIERF